MNKAILIKVVLGIAAIILIVAIFKNFDFDTYKFDNLALVAVYFIGLAIALAGLRKSSKV